MFIFLKLKAGSHVPHKSGCQHWMKSIKPVVNPNLEEMHPTFLDDDLNFGNNFADTLLMGLDSLDADLNDPDDVTNLFDFSM